jgi:hypothetical protein
VKGMAGKMALSELGTSSISIVVPPRPLLGGSEERERRSLVDVIVLWTPFLLLGLSLVAEKALELACAVPRAFGVEGALDAM